MSLRVHIVGRKNSGKTTLVCELVREFIGRGLKVATVKHTHHSHELDMPGKDSHKHRQAGAAGVGILSPHMTAIFVPGEREERGEQRYEQFKSLFKECDLILVEGDLQTIAPRFEVWRAAVTEKPYAADDAAIQTVISDDPVNGISCGVLARADVSSIADRILQLSTSRGLKN